MPTYIIGNDGVTLCHEAPATVNEGEIAVASNEELHAAPLGGKRLLALWNALPGVEKRRKVGDRKALIDQLWSAVEALPEPEPPSDAKPQSKRGAVIAMLRRPEGATVDEVARATGAAQQWAGRSAEWAGRSGAAFGLDIPNPDLRHLPEPRHGAHRLFCLLPYSHCQLHAGHQRRRVRRGAIDGSCCWFGAFGGEIGNQTFDLVGRHRRR